MMETQRFRKKLTKLKRNENFPHMEFSAQKI